MKKSILALCALAFAFTACQEKDPVVTGNFTLESESEITVPTEGGVVNVNFTTNVSWTAGLDVSSDVAILNKKSGTSEDTSVKVTVVAPFEEKNSSRTITLTFVPEGIDPVVVTLVQNGEYEPYFTVSEAEHSVGTAGGNVSFTISTNVEYEYTTYGDWAAFSIDGNTATFAVEKSSEYDARTAYAWFTVKDIQVPVYDDEGNDTGETTATVVTVTVTQEGNAVVSWVKDLETIHNPLDSDANERVVSIATYGDYLLVSNGNGVHSYKAATGEYIGQLSLAVSPSRITNDDAGNIVALIGGGYQEKTYVYVFGEKEIAGLMAGSLDFSSLTPIIDYANGWYGYGLGNIRVTGDATKDASITIFSAAGSAAGSYLVFWAIKDGVCAEANSYSDYVGLPWTKAVWNSKYCCGKLLGTSLDSGVVFNGYEGNYNLHYNPGTTGDNWQEVYTTGSSWMEGYTALDVIDWNGHKYLMMYGMTYANAYGPSIAILLNIDDPTAPTFVSKQSTYAGANCDKVSYNADLILEVTSEGLVSYVVDGSTGTLKKTVYKAV